jgi:tetratricopeptide (TPR) repeat protein
MRSRLLFIGAAFLVALLFAFRKAEINRYKNRIDYASSEKRKLYAVRCSPNWELLKDWLEDADIPPIPGAGSYQWKISTTSDSAQFYFNQGINCYYSFHIIEAMASFKKAAKFDPNCATLYWAQALAYGPNINDFGYAASPEALRATKNAIELSGKVSKFEKVLIDAMAVRYTADSTDVNRKMLNMRYTAKMKEVYELFSHEPDAATLYADAMMLEHPWDLWTNDGKPKEWTPRIREILERVLSFAPNNPGANHYYIHVMEPSPYAYLALPAADRLGSLTPGLSHTVHMPSHIYLRTGNYAAGVSVNEAAVKEYKKVLSLFAPVAGSDFLYIIHNLHMQTNNAMLAGRSAYSVLSAKQTVESIQKDYLSFPGAMGNLVQYIYMTPTLVDVRFGNWDKLISAEKPAVNMTYANILYHFGKGMAFANKAKLNEAKAELSQLQGLMKDSVLYLPVTPFSPAIDGAGIAENLLIGTIALKEKKFSEAIPAFEEAAVTEGNMVYDEPRDWLLNPKHYLGNAYLKAGRASKAREIFEEDLQNNQENGWALYGLWQALVMENKTAEAAKALERFKKAFAGADIKINAAIF